MLVLLLMAEINSTPLLVIYGDITPVNGPYRWVTGVISLL